MISALVWKDIKLFFRNQFFAVVTVLGLVIYIALYFLLPAQDTTTLDFAVYLEDPAATTVDDMLAERYDLAIFTTKAEMLTSLEQKQYLFGLAISSDQAAAITEGQPTQIDAFYAPGIPAETRQVYNDVLVIIANEANPQLAALTGRINQSTTVLGDDLLNAPIAMRDRIIPMLLLFILAVEVLGLATLIIREIESGTARALITGPVRLHQFFISKALMGMLLACSQALLLVGITGKLGQAPLLLVSTLLLGSYLIVGIGFVIAAISRNNMSVLAWGLLVIVIFSLPAMSIMLPGLATGWIETIPSFFLANALHRILNFGAGWAEVGRDLGMMLAIGSATILLGASVLRRRFA